MVVLAAGRSVRYGRLKQLDPIGPGGTTLLEYTLFDALSCGFERLVIVVRPEHESAFEPVVAPIRAVGADVRLAHQRDDDAQLPRDMENRRRPWGTGFAVLSARDCVEGPFAVGNADDVYGRAALCSLGTALTSGSDAHLVSYALDETLSPAGGVSRGICDVEAVSGRLRGIREGLGLEWDGEGGAVLGTDSGGGSIAVPPRTPVSMNLWGFPPGVWPLLTRDFEAFLERRPRPDEELYLSEAVGRWLDRGELRCQVLAYGEGWLGVTYPEDGPRVATALAGLVHSGVYPRDLWSSFQKGTP